MRAAWALFRREWIRFLRQPGRIASAVGTPIVFWLLIGSGLRDSFALPTAQEVGATRYLLPGSIVLLILFASIFASITLIEDRQVGFLQGVRVAPTGPAALVWGKILGGASQAWAQALLLLPLAPLTGIPFDPIRFAMAAGILALLAIGLSGLGFVFAWRAESTLGFHGVMNLLLMPIWLLSGAIFPLAGAAAWIRFLGWINPLSYGVTALRRWLDPGAAAADPLLAAPVAPEAITLAFAAAMLLASWWVVRRTESR